VALVRGFIFHHRTLIMLDSGASTSILSLDLARRLRLKLESRGELVLNGLDGVKTKVSNKCQVTITLGHRVVYTLDIGVGNIGQGIDCLLGMNFMVAAVVRLCANEGEVVLPDEERILLVGCPQRDYLGVTIDVAVHGGLWFSPGDRRYVAIHLHGHDPAEFDIWAGRSEHWVTLSVFSSQQVPVVARVVNISKVPFFIEPHTSVGILTEKGQLPLGTNVVRHGSYQYEEREFLVYENTRSRATKRRLEAEAGALELKAPPAVERREYPVPTQILKCPEAAAVTEPPVSVTPLAVSGPRNEHRVVTPAPEAASRDPPIMVDTATPPGVIALTLDSSEQDPQQAQEEEPSNELRFGLGPTSSGEASTSEADALAELARGLPGNPLWPESSQLT